MTLLQNSSIFREVLSLILGILSLVASAVIFLLKKGTLVLQGLYVDDEMFLMIALALLFLSSLVLLLNTLGAITHVWRNN
ncbi:hypothetical protein GF342_00330 [Candidatus Woesearchaeota archaeon]|nr:hypothetical protein [Candidatus Woesearchaeota archaeon]